MMDGALKVLADAPREGLTPDAVFREMKRRRLAGTLKGKTPVATLSAKLAVNARDGKLVRKVSPGRYAVRS